MSKPHTIGCRVCGETKKRLTRGLCSTHYGRFNEKRKSLPPAAAEAFEAKCISEGWITENRQGRKEKDPDPFDELLDEVKAEFESDIASHVAAEKRREAQEEAIRQAKATKKRSTQRKAE
ncbi:hypothetical protein [Rhodopirellula bahusiensis]|uniref:hypothetical protein n=1 Tax=Rhodopirellula bahusiensis TaxID=2014065 RepID=UPI003265653E